MCSEQDKLDELQVGQGWIEITVLPWVTARTLAFTGRVRAAPGVVPVKRT